MYDVVFVSNGEENAEENWQRLLKVEPKAQRIDGVNGIHAAYHAAGMLATHDYVYLVDADNEVLPTFDFQKFVYPEAFVKVPHVITWRTKNRVNSLIYGHGGITLYPTSHLRNAMGAGVDVAQGLGIPIRTVSEVASIHAFDFSHYNTWRTAFREGVKLKRAFLNKVCENAQWRLNVWMSEGFGSSGLYAIEGARYGSCFFETRPDDYKAINSEGELKKLFERIYATKLHD